MADLRAMRKHNPLRWISVVLLCWMAQAHADSSTAYTALPSSAWQMLNQAPGIGADNPATPETIQVIFDPNCPYSAVHYRQMQSHFAKVPIRWVPLDYYKPDSQSRSAAILAAKDPAAALNQNFKNYDFKQQQGGHPLPAAPITSNANQRRLQEHWMQWAAATPITVVRTPEQQTLMFFGTITNEHRQQAFRAFIDKADGLKPYHPPAASE